MSNPTHTTRLIVEIIDPSDENPNTMTKERYQALVDGIKRFGFTQPILARPHPKVGSAGFTEQSVEVIDGTHRRTAAQDLGYTVLPVVLVDVSDEEARVLRIAMNRLRGELNLATVEATVQALAASNWSLADLLYTGFNSDDLSHMLTPSYPDEQELLSGGGIGDLEADAKADATTFPLVLEFANEADLKKARRALKKAAGKGQPLGIGLLQLIDNQVAGKPANEP